MRVFLTAVLWSATVLGMTGCDMINNVAAPIDRNRLIEDMTGQLERGGKLRYQAEYQLVGGHRATVAQQASPMKTAYGWPGGLLIVSETDRTSCDLSKKPPKCEIRALSNATSGQPTIYTDAAKKGLVTGPVAADLLRAASLQPTVTVKPHDTTIAGLQASCLEVLGLAEAAASNFTTCVTADGVLASFSGVVNSVNVDLALTRMELKAPDDAALAVPAGANVADLRQA